MAKLEKLNFFIYIALAKYCWVINFSRVFKSYQKYFARQLRKSWKPQKIFPTIRKLFNLCAHSWREFAEGVLHVVLFTVLWFMLSVKEHCVAKVLLEIWENILHENNRSYDSYRFSYKFGFILFLSFFKNQSQKSGFQKVVGLVMRNISVFYFFIFFIVSHALLQSHAEFSRLLHIILVCILIPC